MDNEQQLIYLKDLTQKYGRYLRQYFGFSLKEIAIKTGLSPKMFLMILHGQKKMPDKYCQKFIEVFKEMDIENKTKGFKPTESQLHQRSLNQRICLTILLFPLIMLSMVTFPEYIRGYRRDNQLILKFFNRAFDFLLNAFFVFVTSIKNNLLRKPTSNEVGFLF